MDFTTMTLVELREVARSKGLKSVSAMKKADLIAKLQELSEGTGTGKPAENGNEPAVKEMAANEPPVQEQTREESSRPTAYESGNGQRAEQEVHSRRPVSAKRPEMTGRHMDSGRKMRPEQKRTEGRPGRGPVRQDMRQPEVMKYESRPAARMEYRTENRSNRIEVQEKQGYEPERERSERMERPERVERTERTERPTDEKRTINIRNEVFTGDEFLRIDNPEIQALDSGNTVNGILEIMEGYGFIRSANYLPGDNDIYVSSAQIRRFNLKTGDILNGNTKVKLPTEKFSALLYINSVNGFHPLEAQKRRAFEELTPIFPNEKIKLEQPGAEIPMRIVDVIAPIGKGQRGMIVSPPKAGKTTLLKQMAKTISRNYSNMHLLVLLIDERPEEVTDIRESIEGPNVEVIYSTFDELPEHHKRVAEMVLERAKRLVEHKKDVVILLDSITRLARAYNLIVPPSGRTLTGGLDPAALHMPKKFFGAARNIREGGSLTILATALVETGSKMDDVVFEEFKGTGNMELVLDRKLSEKRIFPAIDITKSGTRRDDLLLSKEEQDAMYLIRREIGGSKGEEAIEEVLKLFVRTKNNQEFLDLVQKSLGRR